MLMKISLVAALLLIRGSGDRHACCGGNWSRFAPGQLCEACSLPASVNNTWQDTCYSTTGHKNIVVCLHTHSWNDIENDEVYINTVLCAQQVFIKCFVLYVQWKSCHQHILFLQLALDFNKLARAELGQVRLRAVRATADVRVCALCCSGEMQLVRCQAKRNTQAHNSSSLQAPPQSIPLKGKRTEECPSIPHSLCHRFSFPLSHRRTQTHANTEAAFKLRFD